MGRPPGPRRPPDGLPAGRGPHPARVWPRADHNGQQLHLDFDAGSTWAEMDTAHERVLALGARPLDEEDREKKDFVVYADPAGHPFCLCRIDHR
ncbi:VOC family protein [Streptomyces griseofuscus]|uniref:VOC family protein n=1 Tax=Streptomyces griseofuscus TaxID=146922 RepID=UPI0034103D80